MTYIPRLIGKGLLDYLKTNDFFVFDIFDILTFVVVDIVFEFLHR